MRAQRRSIVRGFARRGRYASANPSVDDSIGSGIVAIRIFSWSQRSRVVCRENEREREKEGEREREKNERE